MRIETLELRRLLSVSLDVPAKTLTIEGKDGIQGDDVISASVADGKLTVDDNGAMFAVTSSAVKSIVVYLRAGGDHLTLAPSVTQRAVVYSGSGAANAAGDEIQTGSGNDEIHLESNFSTASGGAGDDVLYNHKGINILHGNGGNDRFVADRPSDENAYDGGLGYDTADFSGVTDGVVLRNGETGRYAPNSGNPPVVDGPSHDFISEVEAFFGGSGNDYIYGDGSSNRLKGNGGNDYISGAGGNDTIDGGGGHNVLFGGQGNDLFYTRNGVGDYVNGGTGFDRAQSDAFDTLDSIEGLIP